MQIPDIALPESDVFDPRQLRPALRGSHHVRRVVQTGDLRLRQVVINGHRQDAGPDRHFQQRTAEILRYTGECLLKIADVFLSVHVPDQPADRFPGQRGICHHPIIEACMSAGEPVGTFDLILSAHIPLTFLLSSYTHNHNTVHPRQAYILSRNRKRRLPHSWYSPNGTWRGQDRTDQVLSSIHRSRIS